MSHELKKEQLDKLECKQVVATRAKSVFSWGRALIFILIVLIFDGFLLEELIDRNSLLSDAMTLWTYIQIPVVVTVVLIVGYFHHKVTWNNRHMEVHPIVLIEGDRILVRNGRKGETFELKNITDINFSTVETTDSIPKNTKKSNGKVTFQYNKKKVCVGNVYDAQRATRVLLDLIEKLKDKPEKSADRSIY